VPLFFLGRDIYPAVLNWWNLNSVEEYVQLAEQLECEARFIAALKAPSPSAALNAAQLEAQEKKDAGARAARYGQVDGMRTQVRSVKPVLAPDLLLEEAAQKAVLGYFELLEEKITVLRAVCSHATMLFVEICSALQRRGWKLKEELRHVQGGGPTVRQLLQLGSKTGQGKGSVVTQLVRERWYS